MNWIYFKFWALQRWFDPNTFEWLPLCNIADILIVCQVWVKCMKYFSHLLRTQLHQFSCLPWLQICIINDSVWQKRYANIHLFFWIFQWLRYFSTVCIFTTQMYNNSCWLMPSIIKVWRRRHESIMNQPQVLIKVFVLSYLHNSHGVHFQQNGSLYIFLFFIKRNS